MHSIETCVAAAFISRRLTLLSFHSTTLSPQCPSARDSENAVFWRGVLLNHLSKMLSAGNYAPAQHSRHLDFFSEWVVPFLGPKPRSINGKDVPVFNSYMCDDNTPIEFSTSWKPGSREPMVRFSIEPLPPDEHTAPSNIVAYGLHAMDSLHRALQDPVSSISDYLLLEPSLFTKILNSIRCSNVQKEAIIVSISSSDLIFYRVMCK
jgi:DMATS type aromatic prenyltransferase